MRRRKDNRLNYIIVLFIVLSAIAYGVFKTGLPFAESGSIGATSTAKLQDELLYKWDDAKRSNYNAQFRMVLEAKDIENALDSLRFLPEYVEKYKGVILSKYEYMIRVPVEQTQEFSRLIKTYADLVRYSSDYSTSLNAGSLESYNDSLITMQTKRKDLEQLRRQNPNIKGYTDDIIETDQHINRLNSMKQSLQNQDYDLYLVSLSEKFNKGINSGDYIKSFAKPFLLALVALMLGVPLIILGAKLIFQVVGAVGASTAKPYSSYGSKGSSYSYGRKRQVKRIYKDKPSGSDSGSAKDETSEDKDSSDKKV